MNCYVINLDREKERWKLIEESFSGLPLNLIRIPAVDVSREPRYLEKEFHDARKFRRTANRNAKNGEIGCYVSHLKALECFLKSGDEHAIICEDDVEPQANVCEILEETLKFSEHWDLLRLAGCRKKNFVPMRKLLPGAELGWNVKGFTITAAYAINRKAAQFVLEHFFPMTLQYDLMLFSGWPEMKEMSVSPPPFQLNALKDLSTIGRRNQQWNDFMKINWFSSLIFKWKSRRRRYRIQIQRIRDFQKTGIQNEIR